MNIKQGEIILFEFPYTDFSAYKKRPALVISNDVFNMGSLDVVTVAITTQENLNKFQLEIDQRDIVKGEILKKSYIKCGDIMTVEKSIILAKVAVIKKEKLNEVLQKVHNILS
ncbi:MAG: MazF family transcriptional regulator, mRNA interferase [Candidatus Peregrinibacteria bacterium GW2011_GWF2_33_10]|nr:MAG: MazF family transcriptional regulator, mRNA interferase [Candidatus Peregrinibacteria bacterium GW2011_GWF2_33_10]OGJ45430.1 MAG: hypothetical protein A2263_04150 [Candidatus Peregrinibacteria bacterium RIFOXYA2_FULL_33_21]OGJ45551.1 MAG: hypothetical protein A2272_01070 [Candidatus Peregrinibacteria bacterium RIFOXYA12_FULL_33_12]OGJ51033.1 MAG: hypothetical protein A2307_05745 [Candidatus Peregrinibacteria bacterium RIFOXYB2_FULL_33_20]